MSSKDTVRICFVEDGITYNISAIHLLSDRSFKVDVPYCNYDRGLIVKFPTTYKTEKISKDKYLKAYFSSKRPQLSIHASGFVQFSGPGITSGIDSETKEIKGMGLQSNPLIDPVSSGPTFGITCYGFKNGYEKVETDPANSIVYQKDILLESLVTKTDKAILNTFVLYGWVIPVDKIKILGNADEGEMTIRAMTVNS
jgi:hypothetical protein